MTRSHHSFTPVMESMRGITPALLAAAAVHSAGARPWRGGGSWRSLAQNQACGGAHSGLRISSHASACADCTPCLSPYATLRPLSCQHLTCSFFEASVQL